MTPKDKLKSKKYPPMARGYSDDINDPIPTDYDMPLRYPPIAPIQGETFKDYQPLKKIRRGLKHVTPSGGSGGRRGNQGTL